MGFLRKIKKTASKLTGGPSTHHALSSPTSTTSSVPSGALSSYSTDEGNRTQSQSYDDDRGDGDSISNKHHPHGLDASIPDEEVNMDLVPELVYDIVTANDPSEETATRALRMLFALSEHSADDANHNREELVHNSADGRVIPTLLNFLKACERGSSEQYLILLVLNNLSIPAENKHVIAMHYGGAHVLSRLLCEDVSCHLMVIILVNLTFADAELRRELVDPKASVQLVDALAYAFRIASSNPADNRATPNIDCSRVSPRQLLARILAEDRHRAATAGPDPNTSFDPRQQLYPETARWCLCALKNLTRPSNDPIAAKALIETGIVPNILAIITVGEPKINTNGSNESFSEMASYDSEGFVRNIQYVNSNDVVDGVTIDSSQSDLTTPESLNAPSTWDANSMQDAALFTILNLASMPISRSYLRKEDTVHILSLVADYSASSSNASALASPNGSVADHVQDLKLQQQFQSIKARMGLSYLVGGEGHYGQPKGRTPTNNSVLLIMASECKHLLEILANVMHQRAKNGPGGYSAATFTVKGVLYAVRCLLTNYHNQKTIMSVCGIQLNALLLKALAQHCVLDLPTIDVEAAEHAAFSLYLMSSFGFNQRFLPNWFDSEMGLAKRVFTQYFQVEDITPAGRHASEQMLRRLNHLKFGNVKEYQKPADSDYGFDEILFRATMNIEILEIEGTKPMDEIFDRPILRSRAPKRGELEAPWDNPQKVSEFPSAINAVQEFSFGSNKVRHMDGIDDVLIANNIAQSAGGSKIESYNYWWCWKDRSDLILKKVGDANDIANMNAGLTDFLPKLKFRTSTSDEPFSIFGMKCGAGI